MFIYFRPTTETLSLYYVGFIMNKRDPLYFWFGTILEESMPLFFCKLDSISLSLDYVVFRINWRGLMDFWFDNSSFQCRWTIKVTSLISGSFVQSLWLGSNSNLGFTCDSFFPINLPLILFICIVFKF